MVNWEQFKKDCGIWVQFVPIACRLDEEGNELAEVSHDWRIESFPDEATVSLVNRETGHVLKLGKDHIYDFRSNPARSDSGAKHGFLVLKMQVFMQGNKLWYRPNARPGEGVSPHRRPKALSDVVVPLLTDIARSQGWSGTRAGHNKHAARLLYGAEFADLLSDLPDYFSGLVVNGYVWITSLTDHGNLPDGSPDTTMTIELTKYGRETLGQK